MAKLPTYRNLVEIGEERVKTELKDLPEKERRWLAENRMRRFCNSLGYGKEISLTCVTSDKTA